jgi:hypothetical protein
MSPEPWATRQSQPENPVTARRATPPDPATLEDVLQVDKCWTVARFAAAQGSEFLLAPQRFELWGTTVKRHAIAPNSLEASCPFGAIRWTGRPTAWSYSTVLTVLADSQLQTIEHEQEIVQILAIDDHDTLTEAAHVIRITGLPPCLGAFRSP